MGAMRIRAPKRHSTSLPRVPLPRIPLSRVLLSPEYFPPPEYFSPQSTSLPRVPLPRVLLSPEYFSPQSTSPQSTPRNNNGRTIFEQVMCHVLKKGLKKDWAIWPVLWCGAKLKLWFDILLLLQSSFLCLPLSKRNYT